MKTPGPVAEATGAVMGPFSSHDVRLEAPLSTSTTLGEKESATASGDRSPCFRAETAWLRSMLLCNDCVCAARFSFQDY